MSDPHGFLDSRLSSCSGLRRRAAVFVYENNLLTGRFVILSLLLLGAGVFCGSAFAQDIAVLWDVSGSMSAGQSAAYSEKFRSQIADLLLGHGIDQSLWTVTAPEPIPPGLENILTAGIAKSASRVLVVRFGTLRRAKYPALPYFDSTLIDRSKDYGYRDALAAAFPTKATDGKTNKDLVLAAASRYWFDRNSPGWYLVTISDFNQDSDVLNDAEQQLVDQFTTGRLAARTASLVLRWRSASFLQVRIEFDPRAINSRPIPALEPRVLEITKPRNGEKLPNGARPLFAWSWGGGTTNPEERIEYFSVIVTPRGSAMPIFKKSVRSGPVMADKTFPAGEYTWQVVATFVSSDNGNRLPPMMSTPATFLVQSSRYVWLIFLLLLGLVLGGAYGLNRWRENRRKAA